MWQHACRGEVAETPIRANNALWVLFLPPVVDTFQCIFLIIIIIIIIMIVIIIIVNIIIIITGKITKIIKSLLSP